MQDHTVQHWISVKRNSATWNIATLKGTTLNSAASLTKKELSWQLTIITVVIMCCFTTTQQSAKYVVQQTFF